ncbi:MAG: phosphate acyltransferase PlsX [Candidatus Syntrophonatronum acetioxidans]|uniref:Phosphate acyltransferase n=1 Tax=Candidatus Syntrophonatronum acetioxidans TaxID=1795816 RepID=A0A424YCU3_9FIRM|nr:MAG: phosphate acyltransferase PlsX [Candidatus Syntrophonatronum acetioxidans]
MIKIAVDAMGGDQAPGEIVKGSVDAIREIKDLEIILVGREREVSSELEKLKDYPRERVRVENAKEVIGTDEQPGLSVRKKKESSLIVAMKLVKEGQADAIVTAGNTGAFVAAGLFVLGRIKGISRPALAPVIPSFKGDTFMLLDVGAYVDARPENLLHYAVMGNIYATKLMGKEFPRIGLLNIGEEPGKGNELTKETYPLLEQADMNFKGNVEARDLMNGVADVIICDGFIGNIILKVLEGFATGLFGAVKNEISKRIISKAGAFLLLPSLKNLKKELDYTEHGGAPLLGVNGICIKSHGSSNAKTFKNALVNQAYPLSVAKVNERIKEDVKKLSLT